MAKLVIVMSCLLAATIINGMPVADEAAPVVPLANQESTDVKKITPEDSKLQDLPKIAEAMDEPSQKVTEKKEEKKEEQLLMAEEPKSDLPSKPMEEKKEMLEQPQKTEEIKSGEQLKVASSETVAVQAIEPAPVSIEEVPAPAASPVATQKDVPEPVAEVQPIVKSAVAASETVVEPVQAKKIDEVPAVEKKVEEPVAASAKAAEDSKLKGLESAQIPILDEKKEEPAAIAEMKELESKATETATKVSEAAPTTVAAEKIDSMPAMMEKSNSDAHAIATPEQAVQPNVAAVVPAVQAVGDVNGGQVSESQASVKSSVPHVDSVVAIQQTPETPKEQRSEDKVGVETAKVASIPQENSAVPVAAAEQEKVVPAVAVKAAEQEIKAEEPAKLPKIEEAQSGTLAATEMKKDEEKKDETPMPKDSAQNEHQLKSEEKKDKESSSEESSSEEKKEVKKLASDERSDSSSEEDQSAEPAKPIKNSPIEELPTKAPAS